MPIIVKGNMIVENVEQSKSASQIQYKWDSVKRSLATNQEEKTTVVAKKSEVIHEKIEPSSHYHIEHHGELEKMFNLKSEYLNDILDLKNNK